MKLPAIIQRELDRVPGRWTIEAGRKHLHVRIDGRLVTILSHNGRNDPTRTVVLNSRSNIRRYIDGRTA